MEVIINQPIKGRNGKFQQHQCPHIFMGKLVENEDLRFSVLVLNGIIFHGECLNYS